MTQVRNDAKVDVSRSIKVNGAYSTSEWFLTTRVKDLRELLGLRHRDAVERVKRELLSQAPLVTLYVGDARYSVGFAPRNSDESEN